MSGGKPLFDCKNCSETESENRNCNNYKKIEYTAWESSDSKEYEYIKEAGVTKVFSLGNLRLYECPLTWINPESVELMNICYLIDSSGVLLFSGGWHNQPAWLWEAFRIYKIETNTFPKDNG